MPNSDGYVLYSALLNRMSDSDEETGQRVHDTDFASIAVSSLSGSFGGSERKHHKSLKPEEDYRFHIGVMDPEEREIFQSLVKPLVLGDGKVRFDEGILKVEEFASSERSFDDIVQEATEAMENSNSLKFSFESPTCIQFRSSSVTEMFPHRVAVFNSLLSKWNRVAPEDLRLDVTREEIGTSLIEKPDLSSLRTHSVVTNRIYDQNKGHKRPIFKQGFTGRCTYQFTKEVPKDLKNALTILALFAEYSGVGSAVARGCGAVEVDIDG